MTTAALAAAAPRSPALAAFAGLLARDLTVLRKQPADFISRTVVQPVLFVFVLGYITPRIEAPSGSATQAATTLLAGMLAIVILFQGLFAVALPLVQDLGYTREIDDRLLAPLPAQAVALEKIALVLSRACSPPSSSSRWPCSSRPRRRPCTSIGPCCSPSPRWPPSCAPASGSSSAPPSTPGWPWPCSPS